MSLNWPTYNPIFPERACVGRIGQKDTEAPEYPHLSRPVEKCIDGGIQHFNKEDQCINEYVEE